MNTLLLYPAFPVTFWSLKHALRLAGKKSVMPPLGLLTVAAMLPASWNLRLIDLNVQPLRSSDLMWADLAMISAMGVQRDSACDLIARCKQAGLKVVAGGPLFTAQPDDFPQVDHLVLNEAELTLPEFLTDLDKGCAQPRYTTSQFADMHRSPVPRWDLLDQKRYFTMSVQYSRGCPFNCEFCNVTSLLGRKHRTKSPTQMIRELSALRKTGWRQGVFFVDDNLIGSPKVARRELLPALTRWRSKFHTHAPAFNTQASINVADDPQLLQQLAQAGFDTLFIGIETPDSLSLQECGKSQNRKRDLIRDVRAIHHAGLQVQAGFIVGFDSDQPSIFQRQIDFIQKAGIVTAMVGILNALPGTALHQRLQREGRLLDSGNGNNVDGTTNFRPVMPLDTLTCGYRSILQGIYAPRPYYQRIRTFLRMYQPARPQGRPSLASLMTFVKSMLWLGVLGRERFHYWHLLVWTLCRRPTLLSQAITLAITGHHFRRICCEIQPVHDQSGG